MKALNYKVGAYKRNMGTGKADFAPGTLITKMNAQKANRVKESITPKTKLAIKGLV